MLSCSSITKKRALIDMLLLSCYVCLKRFNTGEGNSFLIKKIWRAGSKSQRNKTWQECGDKPSARFCIWLFQKLLLINATLFAFSLILNPLLNHKIWTNFVFKLLFKRIASSLCFCYSGLLKLLFLFALSQCKCGFLYVGATFFPKMILSDAIRHQFQCF